MILLSRQGSKTGWLPIPHLHDIYSLFLTISANSKIYLLLIMVLCGIGLFSALLTHFSPDSQLKTFLSIQDAALATYGDQHPRLFFIVARLSSNEDVLRTQTAENWLDSHYHLIEQIVTPTITIRLYVTGTGYHP